MFYVYIKNINHTESQCLKKQTLNINNENLYKELFLVNACNRKNK